MSTIDWVTIVKIAIVLVAAIMITGLAIIDRKTRKLHRIAVWPSKSSGYNAYQLYEFMLQLGLNAEYKRDWKAVRLRVYGHDSDCMNVIGTLLLSGAIEEDGWFQLSDTEPTQLAPDQI